MTEQTPYSEIPVVINKRIGEHTPLQVGSTNFFDKFRDAGEEGKPTVANSSVQIAQRIAEIDKSPMMPHNEWLQMWDEERERREAPPEEPESDEDLNDDESPEETIRGNAPEPTTPTASGRIGKSVDWLKETGKSVQGRYDRGRQRASDAWSGVTSRVRRTNAGQPTIEPFDLGWQLDTYPVNQPMTPMAPTSTPIPPPIGPPEPAPLPPPVHPETAGDIITSAQLDGISGEISQFEKGLNQDENDYITGQADSLYKDMYTEVSETIRDLRHPSLEFDEIKKKYGVSMRAYLTDEEWFAGWDTELTPEQLESLKHKTACAIVARKYVDDIKDAQIIDGVNQRIADTVVRNGGKWPTGEAINTLEEIARIRHDSNKDIWERNKDPEQRFNDEVIEIIDRIYSRRKEDYNFYTRNQGPILSPLTSDTELKRRRAILQEMQDEFDDNYDPYREERFEDLFPGGITSIERALILEELTEFTKNEITWDIFDELSQSKIGTDNTALPADTTTPIPDHPQSNTSVVEKIGSQEVQGSAHELYTKNTFVKSLKGQNKPSPENEDFSFPPPDGTLQTLCQENDITEEAIKQRGLFYIISDGVTTGGHGKDASTALVSATIKAFYSNKNANTDTKTRLIQAIVEGKQSISHGSTTGVFCVEHNGKIYVSGVGDTRLYGYNKNGDVVILSKDSEKDEEGRLTIGFNATLQHQKLIDELNKNYNEWETDDYQALILLTDGSYEGLGEDDNEIIEKLRNIMGDSGLDDQEIMKELVDEARNYYMKQAGFSDDTSAMIVRTSL